MVIDAVVKHTRTQSVRSYQWFVSGMGMPVNKANGVNGGIRVNHRAGVRNVGRTRRRR